MNNSEVDNLVKEMVLRHSKTCLRCGLLVPMRLTGAWVCSGCGFHWRYLNSDPDRLQYGWNSINKWRDVPERCLFVVESTEEAETELEVPER